MRVTLHLVRRKEIILRNRTKKYAAALAALAVAVSLGASGAAVAGAYWKDSARATEVIIEPGNLDINEVGSQSAVRDISANGIRGGTIVDTTKDKIVPGDTWVRDIALDVACLLYTSPSPRDVEESRMPSSA